VSIDWDKLFDSRLPASSEEDAYRNKQRDLQYDLFKTIAFSAPVVAIGGAASSNNWYLLATAVLAVIGLLGMLTCHIRWKRLADNEHRRAVESYLADRRPGHSVNVGWPRRSLAGAA
jgi:hypothetical protein